MEIPRRYGVDQTVGDTLGPGGIFRGLRSMNALEEIAADMRELCPDALLLQYANPMAINCWLRAGSGHPHRRPVPLGAAHGRRCWPASSGLEDGVVVPGGRHQPPGVDARTSAADGRDVTAELRARRERVRARGARRRQRQRTSWYGGGRERVRTAIMDLTGYFQTESSHHASEYLPVLPARRRAGDAGLSARALGLPATSHAAARPGASCSGWPTEVGAAAAAPSEEYAASIVDSLLTDARASSTATCRNTGLITNLPDGCCVEVPCLVNANGVQPTLRRAPARRPARR